MRPPNTGFVAGLKSPMPNSESVAGVIESDAGGDISGEAKTSPTLKIWLYVDAGWSSCWPTVAKAGETKAAKVRPSPAAEN